MTEGETILWQRLDTPGHEVATIRRQVGGWFLRGVAIFAQAGTPCRVEYEIDCDTQWVTRACTLAGALGASPIHLEITRDAGRWTMAGAEVASLRGCDDIDLGFSPVTNLLPIRRLALPIGARAAVRAAWVRFPQLSVEVLEQSYTRMDAIRYQYESAGGAFRRELTTNAFGSVTEYPGLWHAEVTASYHAPA